jgi:hypothetical protein
MSSAVYPDEDLEKGTNVKPDRLEQNIQRQEEEQSRFGIWEFPLGEQLERPTVCLAPGEEIRATWKINCSSMTTHEWFVTFFTAGFYYFLSRIYLQRVRVNTIFITNQRIIVKEEMFETSGCLFPSKVLIETQASYPLSAVKYACVEHLTKRMFGLIPPSVMLEIHTVEAPSWKSLPPVSYEYGGKTGQEANINAIKAVYGVDYRANAAVITKQIAANHDKFSSILRCFYYFLYLCFEFCKQIALYMFEIFSVMLCGDPIKGSRQKQGILNAHVFHWEVTITEDFECYKHVNEILSAITEGLPHPINNVISPDLTPGLHSKVIQLPDFKNFEPVNNRKPYGQYDDFVYYTNLMPLEENEVFCDVCPDNYIFSWDDFSKIITTFGTHAFFNLHDKLKNWTCSYYLTNRRLVRQQILFSKRERTLKYARSEFWFVETTANTCYYSPQKRPFLGFVHSSDASTFIAGNDNFSLDFRIHSYEFGLKLLKILISHRIKRDSDILQLKPHRYNHQEELQMQEEQKQNNGPPSRTTAVPTATPVDPGMEPDSEQYSYQNEAPLTIKLFERDEIVQSSLLSYPRVPAQTFVETAGYKKTDKTMLTITNYGLYLETCSMNIYSKDEDDKYYRSVVFIGWDKLNGSYWSNFQRWETCPGISTGSCYCMGPCISCHDCVKACGGGLKIRNALMEPGDEHIPPHGYNGCEVRLNMGKGDNTFGFGLGIVFFLCYRFFKIPLC